MARIITDDSIIKSTEQFTLSSGNATIIIGPDSVLIPSLSTTSLSSVFVGANTGSIASPSFRFNDNIETGLYSLGSGNGLGVTIDGSRKFIVNDKGIKFNSGEGSTLIHEFDTSHGFIPVPYDGYYRDNSVTVTGAVKISTPVHGSTDMISFWVDIFDYTTAESVSLFIAGYIYQTTGNDEWVNCTAITLSQNANKEYTVRFGGDGSKNCIWIGETNSTWSYLQIVIRDLQIGYTADVDAYATGWNISIVTSFDTVNETITNTFPQARNSVLLDGLQVSSFLRSDTSDTSIGLINFNAGATITSDAEGKFILKRNTSSTNGDDITHIYQDDGGINFVIDNDNDLDTGDFKIYYKSGGSNNSLFYISPSTLQWRGYNIWHSNNDGPGSGLDSDLLDGQQGAYYLDYNNFANTPTIGNGTITITASTGLSGSNSFTLNQSGNTTITLTNTGVLSNVAGSGISVSSATGTVTIANTGVLSVNGVTGVVTAGNLLTALLTVDGSGSGLDADTVDGIHAASLYSNTAVFHTGPSSTTAGWYTIATNTGDRAIGRFGLNDSTGGLHQSVVFYASHKFGVDASNVITVLHNSKYSGTSPFRYIRIKEGTTYEGAVLQVYVGNTLSSPRVYLLGDNFQSSGWVLKDWIPDATDPSDVDNYGTMTVASQVDLDLVLNGGIITTGDFYGGGSVTQYKLWHSNNDGASSGLDADLIDGIEGSDIVRISQSQTITGTKTFSDGTYLNGTLYWRVSPTDAAIQRADARDDATNFARLHWYGLSDTGATSNFRHAWYDGSSYINVTASNGAVTYKNLKLGDWSGGSSYQGLYHVNQTSGEYVIMSNDIDTFISSTTSGNVYIRGGGNIATHEIRVSPSVRATASGSSIVVASDISGNTSYIPKYTGSATLNNSNIFDSNGRIGIGTNSGISYGLEIRNSNDTQTGTLYVKSNLNSSGKGLVIDCNTRTTSDNSVLALHVISRSNADALAVTVEGNIGIGTSDPAGYKLNINGSLRTASDVTIAGNIAGVQSITSTGTVTLSGVAAGTDNTVLLLNSSNQIIKSEIDPRVWGSSLVDGTGTANYLSKWSDGNTITNSQIVDNGTNVGIGTTSPSGKLHVVTSLSGDTVFKTDGTNGTLFEVVDDLSNSLMSVNDAAGLPVLEVFADSSVIAGRYGLSDFVIASGGNVGIGNSSPTYKLDVTGAARIDGNLYIEDFIYHDGDIDSYFGFYIADGFLIQTGNNQRLLINSTETVFNSSGDSHDFRVESDTDTHCLFVDGSTNNVGIGTSLPSYKLEVNGSFAATSKSFVIDHPTKENYILRYSCLEGPENGVYVRGTNNKKTIELPEYWSELVHLHSITVQVTPVGEFKPLYIKAIDSQSITIGGWEEGVIYSYVIYGTRKDIPELIVEFKKEIDNII